MFTSNRFQPYSLPDTCYRSVPDAFRSADLLTTWLRASVRRVPNLYNQTVVTFSRQGRSYIKGEWSKSSGMASHLSGTRSPTHRFSSQRHQSAATPVFLSRRKVPQSCAGRLTSCFSFTLFPTPDKEDSTWQRVRVSGPQTPSEDASTFIYNGIIPQPIQVLPVIPLHDGPWILGQHIGKD